MGATRSGQRYEFGSIVCFTAFFLLFSLALAGVALGQSEDLVCWRIDTSVCNTPTGDCAFKKEGDSCVHCTAAVPLNSACVFHPDTNCQIAGSAVPVECGNRLDGKCTFAGVCSGNRVLGNCPV